MDFRASVSTEQDTFGQLSVVFVSKANFPVHDTGMEFCLQLTLTFNVTHN